jgi:RNA recognition motif-containing protein
MQEGKSPKFMGEKKLYVGYIAFKCHEDDFYTIFSNCGDVGDVSLVRDEEGRNRGFGFVTMRTNDGGSKAVDKLNNMVNHGRNIAVRESNN